MSANCRSHCRACNSHFSSDGAFDAHRVFEPGHDGDWDHRVCADLHGTLERSGKRRFAVKDEHGKCAIASGHVRPNVRVWSLRASLEAENPWAKMRERKAASHGGLGR